MAYYDVFVIFVGLLPLLRRLTAERIKASDVPVSRHVLAPAE
jgi:hypothetical protein